MADEKRKAYMREYMRKRYAAKKALKQDLPVPVLAEPIIAPESCENGEARESTNEQPMSPNGDTDSDSRGGQSTPKRDPVLWQDAIVRAARAKSYAQRFPLHVFPSDVRFQDPEWQYSQLAKYSK